MIDQTSTWAGAIALTCGSELMKSSHELNSIPGNIPLPHRYEESFVEYSGMVALLYHKTNYNDKLMLQVQSYTCWW